MNFDAELPAGHRSGFVAVVGRPNVGKSTLMNAFLGEKVAIVTPSPQTTRQTQLGILTRDDAQLIFQDTPGLHKPRTELGEFMVDAVSEALRDADVILCLVDVSEPPGGGDGYLMEAITAVRNARVILALNKCDLVDEETLQAHSAAYEALLPQALPVAVSASEGTRVDELLEAVIAELPEGPRFFPADQLTDTHLRDNVAEIVREKVLLNLRDEVPHAVAVQVDEFKERSPTLTYISATIYVERDSQKGIVIGEKGSMLKAIGRDARPDIEEILGTQVYLELWVKVLKNWRKNERALRRLGYKRQS